MQQTGEHLKKLLSAYQTSKLYDKGVRVAILGAPNVGKSSLLNALLIEERAIVTDQAGTTRDVIEGHKILSGLRFVFYDTAGLRETVDEIEFEGIARSRAMAEKADVVLYVTDNPLDSCGVSWSTPTLFILNKSDLLPEDFKADLQKFDVVLSAKTHFHLEALETCLFDKVAHNSVQNDFHVNERQHHKIGESFNFVQNLCQKKENYIDTEILAEEIRHLIALLDEVTGKITNDAVLGEIFQRFCIGK